MVFDKGANRHSLLGIHPHGAIAPSTSTSLPSSQALVVGWADWLLREGVFSSRRMIGLADCPLVISVRMMLLHHALEEAKETAMVPGEADRIVYDMKLHLGPVGCLGLRIPLSKSTHEQPCCT